MCGIFGWQLRKFPKNFARAVISLAWSNEARGNHSYGYTKEDGSIIKEPVSIAKAPLEKLFGQKHATVHTRFATAGVVNQANAHPFEIGKVVGSHNGVISNHHELNRKYGRRFEVDSQHIFAHINDSLPMADLKGYGAIQYLYKDIPNEIRLVRFEGGSLSIRGINHKGQQIGVMWSSTDEALLKAAHLAGLDTFPYKVKESEIYLVQNAELFTLNEKLELGSYVTYNNYSSYDYDYSSRTYDKKYWENYGTTTRRDRDKDYPLLKKIDEEVGKRDKSTRVQEFFEKMEKEFEDAYTAAFVQTKEVKDKYLAEYASLLKSYTRNKFIEWLGTVDELLCDEVTHRLRNEHQIHTGGRDNERHNISEL